MSQFKVLVTDHVFESFDQEHEILAAAGADLEILQCKAADELLSHLQGVHGLLNTYLPGIDASVFDHAPELKAVVRYGIGVDTIDIPAATERGIRVANVPDYCINEVADHALAHFLCLARKIRLADRKIRRGEWSLSYVKPLKPIYGMRVGIIGFGRIGRAIAQRLHAFGPDIVFHDPFVAVESDGCAPVGLDELLAASDAIIVQCPGTAETRHLLDRDAFAKMTKQPVIINCARAEVIDTDALVWALQTGLVSGAGLDLIEDHESVVGQEHPLRTFDNVVLTPHSAWFSDTAIPTLQRRAAEEMVKVLKGERPTSLLNPEVLPA